MIWITLFGCFVSAAVGFFFGSLFRSSAELEKRIELHQSYRDILGWPVKKEDR